MNTTPRSADIEKGEPCGPILQLDPKKREDLASLINKLRSTPDTHGESGVPGASTIIKVMTCTLGEELLNNNSVNPDDVARRLAEKYYRPGAHRRSLDPEQRQNSLQFYENPVYFSAYQLTAV